MLFKSNYCWLILIGLVVATQASAQTRRQELETQISSHNQEIVKLEQEIKSLQGNLANTAKQATTLKGEVDRLDTISRKLSTDIKLTTSKVSQTELLIERLELDMDRKATNIDGLRASLSEAIRLAQEQADHNLLELALADQSFSDFWTDSARLDQIEAKIQDNIGELRTAHQALEVDRTASQKERAALLGLKSKLADQKQINDQNKKTQSELLITTKNQEANYKSLIADRQAKKEAFESELRNFEAQLKLDIDLSKLPGAGTRPLSWPLDGVFITQQFGVTADSKRLYASGSHNGVDFRASMGTPIKAAADGVVIGSGNTDLVCPGASYGKWVLIKHNNGLTTLSGHLSLIKVTNGQSLGRGSLLGYSGQTGYATGPHLHFTVYASDGVRVDNLKSKVCPGTYTMPVADPRAYLNPLLYLPAL